MENKDVYKIKLKGKTIELKSFNNKTNNYDQLESIISQDKIHELINSNSKYNNSNYLNSNTTNNNNTVHSIISAIVKKFSGNDRKSNHNLFQNGKVKYNKKSLNLIFKNIINNNNSIFINNENRKKVYAILPDNKYLKIWEIINLIFIIYSITVIPYVNAFSENTNIYFNYIEFMLDIYYMIDFLKNFFVAIYQENVLITDLKLIIINYIFTWFLIDLVTAIPFTIIYFEEYNKINNQNQFIKLTKLFK